MTQQFPDTPRVREMRVIPVAGKDSMLLNLSGAHTPHFTRNLVLLSDDAGHTGVSEVPGSDAIRTVLDESKPLVLGAKVGDRLRVMRAMQQQFGARDAAGRGLQTYDSRTTIHAITAIETALLDLLDQHLGLPVAALLGEGQQRKQVDVLGYLFLSGTGTAPRCLIEPR